MGIFSTLVCRSLSLTVMITNIDFLVETNFPIHGPQFRGVQLSTITRHVFSVGAHLYLKEDISRSIGLQSTGHTTLLQRLVNDVDSTSQQGRVPSGK